MTCKLYVLVVSLAAFAHCYVDIDLKDCSLRCGQEPSPALTGLKGDTGESSTSCKNEDDTGGRQGKTMCPQTAYIFPRISTDYIRLKAPMKPIDDLTICTWAKVYGAGKFWGSLASYATVDSDNMLLVLYEQSGTQTITVWLHGEVKTKIAHSLIRGVEHFICFVIDRSDGYMKFYYNGTEAKRLTFSNLSPIPSGGSFVIGQEQDALAGRFDSSQGFHGEIRNYMIWDRILSDTEIARMALSKCNCSHDHSATLELKNIQLEGGVNALHVSDTCQ